MVKNQRSTCYSGISPSNSNANNTSSARSSSEVVDFFDEMCAMFLTKVSLAIYVG